jgi:hypothetical protein
VGSTNILCPHCAQETEVIAIYCVSGTVLDEPLECFTISDIRAIDGVPEALAKISRHNGRGRIRDFAKHCAACGNAIVHIVHAGEGTVQLVALARTIRLSGNEHFDLD